MKPTLATLLLTAATLCADDRPNILFCIADDWGWPHAASYGDRVIQMPGFERLAREGVLFTQAYVSSPSCSPSRAAILTGQYHWRLGAGANLWSQFPADLKVYPEILQEAGYFVGHWRKAWGPGPVGPPRTNNPAGPAFKGFNEFLAARPVGRPFCFWLGASDPHRPYEPGSGKASGIDPAKIQVPAFLPDDETVRSDLADYYFEAQRFDGDVAAALAELERLGELDRTIVVMTGDNGAPFPRGKSNLYDWGVRVPLAMRWGDKVKAGQRVEGFVSLTDLAPTFLQAAGSDVPSEVTGRSLLPVLLQGEAARDYVLFGKERHVPSQETGNPGGYPCRAIRTPDFLYIRNFKPDRWPNGIEDGSRSFIGNALADCDNSPTKSFLVEHQGDSSTMRHLYDLSFAKRPAVELYDVRIDPDQVNNLADNPKYAASLKQLGAMLEAELRATADPRILGQGDEFEQHPYYGNVSRKARLLETDKTE